MPYWPAYAINVPTVSTGQPQRSYPMSRFAAAQIASVVTTALFAFGFQLFHS